MFLPGGKFCCKYKEPLSFPKGLEGDNGIENEKEKRQIFLKPYQPDLFQVSLGMLSSINGRPKMYIWGVL